MKVWLLYVAGERWLILPFNSSAALCMKANDSPANNN